MRLTSKNNRFYDLFTASAANIAEAADLLGTLMLSAPEERPALARQLTLLEHRGDDLTHDIMHTLNTSFITPFDREDVALLAGRLDDVVDDMEAAGDLTVLYQIGSLPEAVQTQADLLREAAAVTARAMPNLRTLSRLERYWIEINEIENRADAVYHGLLADLFRGRQEPMTVIKIKEVVDQLESAADAFERAANVVQSIAAKES